MDRPRRVLLEAQQKDSRCAVDAPTASAWTNASPLCLAAAVDEKVWLHDGQGIQTKLPIAVRDAGNWRSLDK